MAKHNEIIDTVDECITNGVKNNILHLITDKGDGGGKNISINNRRLINFASYSYMGLETDHRLKQGGIKAIEDYGTQFGASRAYVSIKLYDEIESLFSKMYGAHVAIAPSTTLAHQAAIPVLVKDEDAVILDQHVHASVQSTVKMLKARGITIELLRHNSLDKLEERVKELKQKHRKIWYMLDGVYSMYGDFAPLKELEVLMAKYDQLMCYVDDAHGMSWAGVHGTGYALTQIKLQEQVVLLTSMNKAFAASGGAMIFHDEETHRKVRTCGGPLIFSTPIPPPMLGIAVASAKIHLTDEIYGMQENLRAKIGYCRYLLQKNNLPLISKDDSPILFVGMGLPRLGYNMVRRMMQEGFYLSIGLFPAVSMKCTGLRFCITLHHTVSDIEDMVSAMVYHLPKALEEEGLGLDHIYKSFRMPMVELPSQNNFVISKKLVNKEQEFDQPYIIAEYRTINDIKKDEWNSLFGNKGSYDWNGMLFLEKNFSNKNEPENNWEFFYYIIRDKSNNPLLATFYTATLCKDDMFSPYAVSEEIEKKRPLFHVLKSINDGFSPYRGKSFIHK